MRLGRCNLRGLAFPAILRLDLRQPEEHAGHQTANLSTQIDLLGDAHDPHPVLAPLYQEGHSLIGPVRTTLLPAAMEF